MLSFTFADISYDISGTTGVVNLWHTKSGQRNAAYEALPINDPLVFRAWRLLLQHSITGTSPDHLVYQQNAQRFRDRFNDALKLLGLNEHGFRPYSLRRGGATTHYRKSANLSATVERGRWGSAKVARIYICDGLGKETELRIPANVTEYLKTRARNLLLALRPAVTV